MKEYNLEIKVIWEQIGLEAKNVNEAKEKVRDIFEEEYNFRPKDREIKVVK